MTSGGSSLSSRSSLTSLTSRASLEAELADRLGSPAEARWMVEEVLRRSAGRGGPESVRGGPESVRGAPASAGTEVAPVRRRRARGAPGQQIGALAQAVSDEAVREISAMAQRRLAGEPLQYVLGTWSFRTLELGVDPRALIPRPETEQVVEVALDELRRAGSGRSSPPARPGDGGIGADQIVVDLGTGSGAIALSIVAESRDATVWATDVDEDALALAAENLARLGAEDPSAAGRVRLRAGGWFDALPGSLRTRVTLVVSNPPYVSEVEWPQLDPVVRREPFAALVAAPGSDGTPGFAAVETVLRGALAWLAPDGAVVVEHAEHQAGAARRLARSLGYRAVRTAADLAGRERAVVARR